MSQAGGCIPLTSAQVRTEWARMRAAPLALERPVVVAAGWRAWRMMPAGVVRALRELTGDRGENRFLSEAFPTAWTIQDATRELIGAVAGAWPSDDPGWTVEVDVVGVSMGGLVTRLGALPQELRARTPFRIDAALPRLNVRRLFTLATPHRGSRLANRVALDSAAHSMKAGSAFLRNLDAVEASPRPYEMVCYARLRDSWVGAGNTAPLGMEPIWVPTPAWGLGHVLVSRDRRILLDIARRLRGEDPLALAGSTPPRD